MKTQKMILASLLGGLILLAGCQKEGGLSGSKDGQFRFGVSSKVLTRTEYGDYNETGKHQDINWTKDDQIRIYSPTAARRVGVEKGLKEAERYYWADYKIIPDKNVPTNKATIENINNDGNGLGNGLAWERGKESDEHTFYAVYPAVGQRGVEPDEGEGITSVPGTSGEIALNIPAGNQNFSEKGNLEQYGYMTAYAKGKGTDKNISLDFYPAFTAFEISIRSADAAIGFSSFTLSAASETAPALTGSYKAKYDASGNRTYDFTAADAAKGNRSISVNLNGQSAPAASENKDLTFTVLALPRDLSGLSVTFALAGSGTTVTRTLKLNDKNGNPVSFTGAGENGGKKHRIYGLVLSNGELLISVETAPWLAGGEETYTTIENVSTFFVSYQRYNEQNFYVGDPSWDPPYFNYVAIAPGRSTTERVDPDDPTSALNNLPLYSPAISLSTVSVSVPLELRSDNPNIGFIVKDADGIYPTAPSQTLPIRASDNLDDEVKTEFYVVPVGEPAIGQSANITLYRMDCNAPIAYSHKDMPGTTDHLKVPFMVLSASDYQSKTNTEVPSI